MMVLKFFLLVLSSVGYFAFYRLFGNSRISNFPILYISFIVIFLYFFAIFGFLHFGMIFCLVLGFVLGGLTVFKKRENCFFVLKSSYIIYALYFVPFFAFYFSISDDFLFTGWDEFSFWALSIKIIFESNSLYLADSPTVFKSYPPAQQLFQYYLVSSVGWSEKNVLFAQVVFMLSALMCAACAFCNTRSIFTVIVFFTSCTFLYVFGFDFSHIFVDQLLAVYFAACIVLALTEKADVKGVLSLCLVLAVLVLIKAIGLVLSLIVIAIYSLNIFFNLSISDAPEAGMRRNITSIFAVIICAASVFLAFKSWGWYLSTIGASLSFSIPSVVDFFQEPKLQRLGQTVVEFLARVQAPGFIKFSSGEAGFKYFSLLDAMVVMISFSVLLVVMQKNNHRVGMVLSLFVLVGGAFCYLLFLLFSYLVFFSEYEGVRLASFERYSATYFMAWMLVLYAIFCGAVGRLQNRLLSISLLVSCVLYVYFLAPKKVFSEVQEISPPAHLLEKRIAVDYLSGIIKENIKDGEKAYFINQKSTGFEKYMFNYTMLPYHSLWWCWSVGEKYYDGDVWSCDKKLEDLLVGYSYLAIYYADDRFWRDNARYFEPAVVGQASGVFKVERYDGGALRLEQLK